jgi:hypothetical protein
MRKKYSEKDFEELSFHDCYLYGIKWSYTHFALDLDIDYILEWITPSEGESYYSFVVCPASLRFNNIDETRIDLDWKKDALYAQMEEITRCDARRTPNGCIEWLWEINFSSLEGRISGWATGFELLLVGSPRHSPVPGLRLNSQ